MSNVLPYIEQRAMHDLGAGLPTAAKNLANYQRLTTPLSLLNCPTRRPVTTFPWTVGYGLINSSQPTTVVRSDYAANGGTVWTQLGPPLANVPGSLSQGDAEQSSFNLIATLNTGVVYAGSLTKMADVTDGTSNTYLAGEKEPRTRLVLHRAGLRGQRVCPGGRRSGHHPLGRLFRHAPLAAAAGGHAGLPGELCFGSAHLVGFHMRRATARRGSSIIPSTLKSISGSPIARTACRSTRRAFSAAGKTRSVKCSSVGTRNDPSGDQPLSRWWNCWW